MGFVSIKAHPDICTNFLLGAEVRLPSTAKVAFVPVGDLMHELRFKLCKFPGSDIS
jgi:hypothetical protein